MKKLITQIKSSIKSLADRIEQVENRVLGIEDKLKRN
jgi:polyhydroxyalkanoate synthesis regulator phasin